MRKITKEEYKEYKYMWKRVTGAITVVTIIDVALLLFTVLTYIFESELSLIVSQLFFLNLVFSLRPFLMYYFVRMVVGMYIAHVSVDEKYTNEYTNEYQDVYYPVWLIRLRDSETGEFLEISVDSRVYNSVNVDDNGVLIFWSKRVQNRITKRVEKKFAGLFAKMNIYDGSVVNYKRVDPAYFTFK